MSITKYSVFASVIQSAIDRGKPAPDHSTSRKGKTRLTIQEHFMRFHQANPHIYELVVALAWDERNNGAKRLSIAKLWENIRKHIETKGLDYKLNNNFRSRYVRLIEENEPGLRGLFRKRGLTSL
jgi:hypothetical protein